MKYTITVDVELVVGQQIFEIAASSEEEAIRLLKSGEGEIIEDLLEVQSLAFNTARVIAINEN